MYVCVCIYAWLQVYGVDLLGEEGAAHAAAGYW
jgi:hypothetical protein